MPKPATTSKHSVDLNCDLGEYDSLSQGENDAAIMPYISSCNIACGGHAGNQAVIEQTVKLANKHQVQIGAHPAYPDKANFGRKKMHIPAGELTAILRDQIQLVQAVADKQNAVLSHVKPHGALYNQAADDLNLAVLLAEVIAEQNSGLMFYGLAHSAMAQAAVEVGIPFVAEGFVDRAYTSNRTLQARSESGAVIDDAEVMLTRVINLLNTGQIETTTGDKITLNVQTLCLHGDHAGAADTAKILHQGIISAGFQIMAPRP